MNTQTQFKHPEPPKIPRLLRIREVIAIVRKQQSAIYNAIAEGTFPAPIRLGSQSVAWLEDDISAWIMSRPRTTQKKRRAA